MSYENKERLGCLGIILFCLCVMITPYFYNLIEENKRKSANSLRTKNDSIRKAYIADSLAKDPRYQDSIREAEEKYRKWKDEEISIQKRSIIGLILEGDSIYHTSLHNFKDVGNHSCGFLVSDRRNIVFLTEDDIKKHSLQICDECLQIGNVYSRYVDGELISEEDAKEHDLIPIEDACEYCDNDKDWPSDEDRY